MDTTATPVTKQPTLKTMAEAMINAGQSVPNVAKQLDISPNTLYSWKSRYKWGDSKHPHIESMRAALAEMDAVILRLVQKENKTAADLRELEVLGRERRKYAISEAKLEIYVAQAKHASGSPAPITEGDLNTSVKKRGRKKSSVKNHLTDEQIEQLEAALLAEMYEYQRIWHDHQHLRLRNILKSRQIGATYHFAREAIVSAFKEGRNKAFLSASKAQAFQFLDYMKAFVYRVTGVELQGTDKVKLSNGAVLKFYGTNSNTAQGFSADVYADEYFWVPKYEKFNKVSSAIASQSHWRKTYFSSPSATTAEAYPFWTGEHANRGRPKDEHITIDISHEALRDGVMCEDGQWRQIVNIHDALERGCPLFDLEQLKREYSPDEFRQLFVCEFVDDSNSTFKFEQMQRCLVDTDAWKDFDPHQPHPLDSQPVWIGYDPSRSQDAASCVVIAPPAKPGGKFRVLEKHLWYGESFEYQASQIKKLTEKYNVREIGIDTTGLGYGVVELVRAFFPRVHAVHYSLEAKNALVTKAKDVVRNKRLQFSAGWIDVVKAFLMIYQDVTATGILTYKSRRSGNTGHSDVAWAIMYALAFESMDGWSSYEETKVKMFN